MKVGMIGLGKMGRNMARRLFQQTCSPFDSNSLVMRIQPGEGFCVQPVNIDFHYKDLNDAPLQEA